MARARRVTRITRAVHRLREEEGSLPVGGVPYTAQARSRSLAAAQSAGGCETTQAQPDVLVGREAERGEDRWAKMLLYEGDECCHDAMVVLHRERLRPPIGCRLAAPSHGCERCSSCLEE